MVKIVNQILLATDFSPSSEPAFLYALEWAQQFEAPLTILHVLSLQPGLDIDSGVAQYYLDEQRKVAQEQLEKLRERARQYRPMASMELLGGLPSDLICKVAREKNFDLIITGTHGWTGFDRVVFGSVAERVIQRAPCPVLSVPYRDPEELAGMHTLQTQPKHVVLPLNFSDCSIDAYEYATQIASWFDASMTLVHAIEPLSYSLDFSLTHPLQEKTNRKKVEMRLAQLTKVLSDQGLSVTSELVDTPAVEAIVETSAIQQADLIIMGTHGRKGLSRMILGSTTDKVLERSPYPILTVKSPKYTGGHHPSLSNNHLTASST